MLKLLLPLTLLLTAATCKNEKSLPEGCFKGRLSVKGICSNYTITVLEGRMDSSLVEPRWTDENTGKTYTSAFALGSPCTFPPDLEEGAEFYFSIEPEGDRSGCNVCMAFYPTPARKLAIRVLPAPCR